MLGDAARRDAADRAAAAERNAAVAAAFSPGGPSVPLLFTNRNQGIEFNLL
jgi:hypothetical protein